MRIGIDLGGTTVKAALCTEDGAYDDESLHEAALLAAYYSQAPRTARCCARTAFRPGPATQPA